MIYKYLLIFVILIISTRIYSQNTPKPVEERIVFNIKNNLPRYEGIDFSVKVNIKNSSEIKATKIDSINLELLSKFNLIHKRTEILENQVLSITYNSPSKASIQTIKSFFISKDLNVENIENLMFLK